MSFSSILWDLDDDPNGNVQHIAEHGISKEEVEEALANGHDQTVSRSSGRPVIFGDTRSGRHLMVAFELHEGDVVYPVTAFEVPRARPQSKRKRRRK